MSDAAEIKTIGDSLDPDVTFDIAACEAFTAVPKMFRKMALKAALKAAKEQGLSVVTKELAESLKPGG